VGGPDLFPSVLWSRMGIGKQGIMMCLYVQGVMMVDAWTITTTPGDNGGDGNDGGRKRIDDEETCGRF